MIGRARNARRLAMPGVVILLAVAVGFSASDTLEPDRGAIRIHLLGHAIGSERYGIRRDGNAFALTDTFEFTDRGGHVQLATTMRLSPSFESLSLRSTGRTYRFVNVDASVSVDRPKDSFAIAGYAPLETQALLVRYWQSHGRPKSIVTLPANPTTSVSIEDRGSALFKSRNGTVELHRYSIDGVAWGREILYLDASGRFAAIATRANLLPLEGVREDLAETHPSLLDSLLADAARTEIDAARATKESIQPVASGEFALVGARIIDGTKADPVDDGTIVVRNGRIAAIGARTSVAIPSGMRVIDVHGKTIIPGLWDMHTHVAMPEWGPEYLGVGVTTIRDMGGEKTFLTAFRDAIAADNILGPRVLLAGLVDGSGPEAFGAVHADTPDEGRAVVNAYHAAGFQQMKLYTLIKPDVAGAIMRRAHEMGMTVTGHVPRAMTLESMVDSGTDNVAHLPVRGDTSSAAVKRQVQMLAGKHVVIDPTVSWNELLGHANQTPLISFQPGFAEAPWPLQSSYGSVRNAGDSASAARALHSQLAVIKALHDAGVPIVAGTDYGLPGFSLLREVELYADAGLTPLEALRAATSVPAEVMGLRKEAGTLEAGKRADLVVLDADPLVDIHNIRTGRWVVSAGTMYDMRSLRRAVHFEPEPEPQHRASLPDSLSDGELWNIFTRMSEPAGSFPSENFVSNEKTYQYVIPSLQRTLTPQGVYLGVGPEQNFTYIANLQPRLAVIFDIRRQNAMLQLMDKALFELSPTRADFVSKLFSRVIREPLAPSVTPDAIFAAADAVPPSDSTFNANWTAIVAQLMVKHHFALGDSDLQSMRHVFEAFREAGPAISYGYRLGLPPNPTQWLVTFAQLQSLSNGAGENMAFLASESSYGRLRDMERRNLVVPVVADFAGPTAVRRVGDYLKKHDAIVTAFYLSYVEEYLFNSHGAAEQFYHNVEALPIDSTSAFIRSVTSSLVPGIGPAVFLPTSSLTMSGPVRLVLQGTDSSGARVFTVTVTDSTGKTSTQRFVEPVVRATVVNTSAFISGTASIKRSLEAFSNGQLATYPAVARMTTTVIPKEP